ncbi:uncharacterized protein BDW43DRAFT_170140 [Aspergillus alliaceus]|uniref:uncharacterized protein n=1 Tax=Petromyces alliaceus TaxID=209559 RepID=UPI0012A5AF85|nr:uncharacterized protein BDW43DRAFT_170140 [Aspergillus alliaceus]KAB8230206.1 hypothetical protein BDW43DRAFT_170140 [Aspergillus alliaceus]
MPQHTAHVEVYSISQTTKRQKKGDALFSFFDIPFKIPRNIAKTFEMTGPGPGLRRSLFRPSRSNPSSPKQTPAVIINPRHTE